MLEWEGSSPQEEVLPRAEGLTAAPPPPPPSLNWEETLVMREERGSEGGFTAMR